MKPVVLTLLREEALMNPTRNLCFAVVIFMAVVGICIMFGGCNEQRQAPQPQVQTSPVLTDQNGNQVVVTPQQQPQADNSTSNMLMGGMLGYMLGHSMGSNRGNGGVVNHHTHTTTTINKTTIVQPTSTPAYRAPTYRSTPSFRRR